MLTPLSMEYRPGGRAPQFEKHWYMVLPNSTDKFTAVIVGSMGSTNRHRTGCCKLHLVGVIRNTSYERCDVKRNEKGQTKNKKIVRSNDLVIIAQRTPTDEGMSGAFKQSGVLAMSVEVRRFRVVSSSCCSQRRLIHKWCQVTPEQEIQGIEVRGARRPINRPS
ncbi:hypothetical protein TNCV_1249931 [Trichonephila clavipes]|nr:hypothetical protein TNCV_1249931 [Trichonephila clavipes]